MNLLAIVGAIVLGLAFALGGVSGVVYACGYVVATLPGWPVGRMLFGRGHPAGWISGALVGYGLTALALSLPVALGFARLPAFLTAWGAMTAATWLGCRRYRGHVVDMPGWGSDTTRALAFVLVLVPAIVALPYARIGHVDEAGNRLYRAYFSADFVWHEALTAELARFSSPPRNPYMASQPLHYYWTYFLFPATVTGLGDAVGMDRIELYLKVNALCTGLLFVAAIFVAAWAAVPRAAPVAFATALTLLSASAEGLYACVDLLRNNGSLEVLRALNVDAVTSWIFEGLRIDGLPRSIWYTPQHSIACALGLVALTIAARLGAAMSPAAAAAAGLSLGLALMMSPFPAGVFTVIYALAVLWGTTSRPAILPRVIFVQLRAVAPVVLALGWCLANATFEGTEGAITFGLSSLAARAPVAVAVLGLGPVLMPALFGMIVAASRSFRQEIRPAVCALVLAAALFYGVTLVLEPVWIGWRAGQLFLVTVPPLIATAIVFSLERLGRFVVSAGVAILFLIGLPTTIIDVFNAQDVSFTEMGPGFRWTVVLTPGKQAALSWIEKQTPVTAVVQMSLTPRGRETWSLIPSFAHRRMAAGLPISLLQTPEYAGVSAQADRMYATGDADEAWRIGRGLGIEYVYVGRVEHDAFAQTRGLAFDTRPDLFPRVFANSDAAVYRLR